MAKITKKGLKAVIIMYYDPELKDFRRVVFGDPEQLMDMFLSQGQMVMERIQSITKVSPKNPKQMKEAIRKSLPDFVISHGADAAEDAEMTLSYELNKIK